jgi:hypothetical protein
MKRKEGKKETAMHVKELKHEFHLPEVPYSGIKTGFSICALLCCTQRILNDTSVREYHTDGSILLVCLCGGFNVTVSER